MTHKQYLIEPALTAWTAKVTAIAHRDNMVVRLDRTIFHPQGGGQKADRGRIGPAVVIHVAHNADDVDHHVESTAGLEVGAEVRLEVDDAWRRLNAAYHTAGHLIASVIETLYPRLKAVAGHQWPGEGRVEFMGDVAADQCSIAAVNDQLARDLAADLSVVIQGDPLANRSIMIGQYAPIPCGGTHVSRLGEIGQVVIKSIKSKGGRIRVGYDAAPCDTRESARPWATDARHQRVAASSK